MISFAVVYFIFTYWYLVPYFEDPDRPHWTFRYYFFGDSPSEVIKYFITHPLDTFTRLFYNHTGHELGANVKLEYYIYFLIWGGWILFRKPVVLLLFLPLIAQKMLMDPVSRWHLGAYHSVEIESILSIGVFFVISRLKKPKVKIPIALTITVLSLAASIHLLNHRYTYWHHEIKENPFSRKMYQTHFNIKEINDALRQIPDEAAIVSTSNVAPHLAYRKDIHIFPHIRNAEYMVLLEDGNPYPLKMEEYLRLKEDYLKDKNWELVYSNDQLYILKKIES